MRVGILVAIAFCRLAACGLAAEPAKLPEWLTYPGRNWEQITPEEAGFDVAKLNELTEKANIQAGTWAGIPLEKEHWGGVLTRGGYMVRTWGRPGYKFQSASLGKCITRALVGISIARGVIKPDEPISKTWTGRGQLSHPHKHLDVGHHKNLTWRQLVNHQGGFILESGYHWRTGEPLLIGPNRYFETKPPSWVRWTKDPLFDNYAHAEPGKHTQYSSGGYWRLGQALTAAWNKDLKQVLDEELFRHMDLPAKRWDWLPGKIVNDMTDMYPAYPNYGDYVDPPYTINGHLVRGGPGWIVMSSQDLARFGLLIATRGMWKGRKLVPPEWLEGHAGLDIHVVAGDGETLVSVAKVRTLNFPFAKQGEDIAHWKFPKELIVGPVRVKGSAADRR